MSRIITKSTVVPIIYASVIILLSLTTFYWSGQEQWGPFSTWDMGPGSLDRQYFDLQLQHQSQNFLLSDTETYYDAIGYNKVVLWKLAQSYGEAETIEQRKQFLEQIPTALGSHNVTLLGVCRILVPIHQFILLDTDKKWSACELLH